ncbi:hypothetical protein EJ063_08740 [Vibrio aquaticus]|uniref:Uncharacterized protein n=1 Tax=Vibrio aquaticus TaxID=2496559 RepID=A0A3S0N6N7_9VIBR|nr:hypothetical protein [Vibrio aquaticus]RTZ16865.1 hypothetical protein EJ063_08740 [Vibrio aquaticus]
MTTVTVFFSGTGATSENNINSSYAAGELVSVLAKNVLGRDNVDYIQVDGVGSGNLSEWKKQTADDTYWQVVGQLAGRGVNSNILHVMNLLVGKASTGLDYKQRASDMLDKQKPFNRFSSAFSKWQSERDELASDLKSGLDFQMQSIALERQKNPITQLNLIGWSRGGVTCFELANALLKVPSLANINVNIFALDPVPGGMNAFKDYKTLGPNVKQIVCVFAQDERSLFFKARMPNLHKNTKFYTTLMPGRHGTLVGASRTSGGSKGEHLLLGPGFITRDFAEKVLASWGTQFKQKSTLCLSKEQILELYGKMAKNKALYNKMHNKVYTAKNLIVTTTSNRIAAHSNFPGIQQQYSNAVNRHHSDVLSNNAFAIKGNSLVLV